MMESFSKMKNEHCAKVALLMEKEVVEETLTATEQQTINAHLAKCTECREIGLLSSSLHSLADELSNEDLNAAITNVLQDGNAQRVRRSTKRKRRILVLLAAGVLSATLLGLFTQRFQTGSNVVSSEPKTCIPQPPRAIATGVWITSCGAKKPKATTGDDGEVVVSLKTGAVALRVHPNRLNPQKVLVQTPFATVEVKGTVFGVYTTKDDGGVEVFRGKVSVTPVSNKKESFDVNAGFYAEFTHREQSKLNAPKTQILSTALLDLPSHHKINLLEKTKTHTNKPASAEESDTSKQPLKSATQMLPARNDDANNLSPKSANSSETAIPSVESLIHSAQQCLIKRKWKCAALKYRKILEKYPHRAEAVTVYISLAKIELRHLKEPKKALAHYQAYHKRHPQGPLAEEALFGIAESHRQLGNAVKEMESLRLFTVRHPKSARIHKADARLRQLQNESY